MHTSVAEGLYHNLTRTDSEGRYVLPGNFSALQFPSPGVNAGYGWTTTVFKPGYALDGDEIAWKEYNNRDWQHFLPHSLARAPKARWWGWTHVEPLFLRKQNLAARDWAIYWTQLFYTYMDGNRDELNGRAIRREAASWITPLLCSSDTEETVGYHLTSVFLAFAADVVASTRRLSDVEPTYADMLRREQGHYKVRDICKAMTEIGAQRVY